MERYVQEIRKVYLTTFFNVFKCFGILFVLVYQLIVGKFLSSVKRCRSEKNASSY